MGFLHHSRFFLYRKGKEKRKKCFCSLVYLSVTVAIPWKSVVLLGLAFVTLYIEQYFYESGNLKIAHSILAIRKKHAHEPKIDKSKEND